MRKGTIVKVERLGRNGYQFKDPAYAVVCKVNIGSDQQCGIDLIVLSQRDADHLTSYCSHHHIPIKGRAFMAPAHYLKKPDEDAVLIVQALLALRGPDLVITCEPVSLAN